MHAAELANSERLQRVYALLADGEEHSTLDIVKCACVCAVNSCVAELRQAGAEIACCMASTEDHTRVGLA